MLDFLIIGTQSKNGIVEIFPDYTTEKSNDLMIRGHDFYAVWDEEKGMWSTDEDVAKRLIDKAVIDYAEEYKKKYSGTVKTSLIKYSSSGRILKWRRHCKEELNDSFKPLNQKVMFSNSKINKRDYASKTLPYPLEEGPIDAYDRLMSVLYSDEERHKIEWAIGALVAGANKDIQKFLVFYGEPKTGKSTVLNIIQKLFEGYDTAFDAKALGDKNDKFALEPFKDNPVVAIQHDGDLSKLEDNTQLNTIVSHERTVVNLKGRPRYNDTFYCILFMGSNKPVKITDAKSGLLRRLIDVSPTGNRVPRSEYDQLIKQINFELSGIAWHCKEVYLSNPNYYDDYTPKDMFGATNDFYSFMSDPDNYPIFKDSAYITLKQAWPMYNTYCNRARVSFPYSQRAFKEELKNYFEEYHARYNAEDGSRPWNVYIGFKEEKFEKSKGGSNDIATGWLHFNRSRSLLDNLYSSFKAQYANDEGKPMYKWDNVTTTLADIDTSKLHYVRVPQNQIVIDFDIKDENGNKSYEKNLEAANKWPPTYAELSKSKAGIHLHYIYDGDVTKLQPLFAKDIEVKVFKGNASLRRMLTKCNGMKIATLNSGLPLKEEKQGMINSTVIANEKGLRTLIEKCLNKEYGSTTQNINFIKTILDEAYEKGFEYDLTEMQQRIKAFAANSTNQAQYCLKTFMEMKFKSKEKPVDLDRVPEMETDDESNLVFFDVEVYPNYFGINWKKIGRGKKVRRLLYPTPSEIEYLSKFKMVGFNCRRYDNHIIYAAQMGYSCLQLYELSRRIIQKDSTAFFSNAYDWSWLDLYDVSSKKQSLKKFEIELTREWEKNHGKGTKPPFTHFEMDIPWDKPVPEELKEKVAEYCDNDVLATEEVYYDRKDDILSRKILKDFSGLKMNDTTNSHTTHILFGNEREPQSEFLYRDLSKPVRPSDVIFDLYGRDRVYRIFDKDGLPTYESYVVGQKLPEGYSILPFFPGYEFKDGVSTYLGETIGEGGRVYAEPGMYGNVWDGDVSSMHPHSIIEENLFGTYYTSRFKELVDARIYIKHKDFESAKKLPLLGDILAKYLTDPDAASGLSSALKIAINSVYGLTSTSFINPFRDMRNVDNIVAKRGALFMTLLKREVQKRGFHVAHIKTDSIKIPDANKDIMDFVINFGKEYGYDFETEEDFEKFCLVNDAVYIAKRKEPKINKDTGKEEWWVATGAQFQVPYVFKTLFSKDEPSFYDFSEIKSVAKGELYLDMNEGLPDGEHAYRFVGRTGDFCPMLPGKGGGILYRVVDDKYYAVAGTKGYRWLEAETVKSTNAMDFIDISYYEKMVKEAIKTISQYGDFDYFVSDEHYSPPLYLMNEYHIEAPAFHVDELPF